MKSSKYPDQFIYLCYIFFFIGLICSLRGVASICIALIMLTGLVRGRMETGSFFNPHVKNGFLIACCTFYIVQVLLLLFSAGHFEYIQQAQLKSGLVFVPLSICCAHYINAGFHQKLMKHFIQIIAAAMAFCLLAAAYKYFFLNEQGGIFFYHALVSPFHQHAVQVSILLFIGLVHLLESAKQGIRIQSRFVQPLLVLYFTGLILLLSSRLVIVFTAACFLYYLFLVPKTNIKSGLIRLMVLSISLLAIIFVLSTHNHISKRFSEIIHSDLSLVEQRDFNPRIYFDGVQFRILQLRFVKEILNEKHAWLTGVSGDAQKFLVQKYISTHMYAGDGKADPGYMKYNTHNQFLESLLQSGIPGLAAYAFIFFAMAGLAIKGKSRELAFVAALLLAYSLNESVLEKQFSIMLFTFFPLLLYYGKKKDQSWNDSCVSS